MNIISVLTVILGGIIQASGAALLKYATTFKTGPNPDNAMFVIFIILAMLLFCCGFPLFARGLSKLKLGIAQPVFSATIFLTTTLISVFIFGDNVSTHQAAGIAAIVGGIVTVIS